MKKWLAVLIGLIALAILFFFCVKHHGDDIQSDIYQRSHTTLQETGLPWVTSVVDGRDVTLTGNAPSTAAKMQAQRITEGLAGVRTVANNIVVMEAKPATTPPQAAPAYTTSVNYDNNRLALTGAVPSMTAANRIATVARQQFGSNVVNRLTVQPGSPERLTDAITSLLPQVKRLSSAQISLSDQSIAVAGTLPNGVSAQQLQAAIKTAIPRGYSSAYALQPAATVIEKSCPPVTPPKACPPVIEPKPCPPATPCAACPKVEECPVLSTPLAVTEPITATLYEADTSIDIASYQECQNRFNSLLSGGSDVLFRISKSEITARGRRVLQAIADAAASCPQANLQVAGHTDSRGGSEMNFALSEQRANAVRSTLINFGVDSYRLSAVGYGESTPIATNETIAGRQANRRVEIIVEGL